MGRQSTMSVLGLYNFDSTIFENMSLPEGIDSEVLIDNLLAECAELEILYPDPNFMKKIIGVWSSKMLDVWTKLYETTKYEYDPIENYNRYEDGSRDGKSNRQHSGLDSHTAHGSSEVTKKQAGYDSVPNGDNDGLVLNDKINGTSDTTGSYTYGQKVDDTENSSYKVHAHGNIGVTTTQKLISEQRKISEFNVYAKIIEDFINRFCIIVW